MIFFNCHTSCTMSQHTSEMVWDLTHNWSQQEIPDSYLPNSNHVSDVLWQNKKIAAGKTSQTNSCLIMATIEDSWTTWSLPFLSYSCIICAYQQIIQCWRNKEHNCAAAQGLRTRHTWEDKSSCSSNESDERSNLISNETDERSNLISTDNSWHLPARFIKCPSRSDSLPKTCKIKYLFSLRKFCTKASWQKIYQKTNSDG